MSEKRSFFLMMLNTTPKETAASYATVGDGVTELTANYNPQTSTEQFIHQDSATTELTGYQPNAPVTAQVVKTDPAFQFVNGLRKKRAIGSDAHTDVVLIDKYDIDAAGSAEGPFPAERQPVSVQIDSYGGPASDPLSISYTVNWRGDGETGTFDPKTKTFTAGAAPTALSREVEV